MKNLLDKENEICEQASAKTANSQQVIELPESDCKSVFVNFNGGNLSSDAGVLIIKEVDRQIGLIENMAKAIPDDRDQRYIAHAYLELLRQRVAQITCGYEDGNDCDYLRTDPSFKIFAERNPESDPALGSQPTMSRFENAISRKSLYRLAHVFVDSFVDSYEKEPKIIVLDFDDTADKTYGAQQITLFNGYTKTGVICPCMSTRV